MNILGISALYHDSAATLCCNGKIIAAAQEERFTRIKGDCSFPINAIKYCLSQMRGSLDAVAYYDNPIITLDRYLHNLVNNNQRENILDTTFYRVFKEKLGVNNLIKDCLNNLGINSDYKIFVCKHHISHAASAFFPSPFKDAAILINDGVGEWSTTSLGVGMGTDIQILKEIRYPDSIGLLYSAFTSFCGFKVNSGEYKLMGLAPYGEPRWTKEIFNNLVELREDGSFKLNQDFFQYQQYEQMFSEKFSDLFKISPRIPESDIIKEYMDIAASIQEVVNVIILRQCKYLKKITNQENIVLAGGCALNCVANGIVAKEKIFSGIWIQPAANDSGGSLGAALYLYYYLSKKTRIPSPNDTQYGSFLGPEYSDKEILDLLLKKNAKFEYYDIADIPKIAAKYLNDNKVIGLFHGRMEFGPRALGHRSIIANATDDKMQKRVNMKIKFRESFRPFASAVLKEDVIEYFDGINESPYMLFVTTVKDSIRFVCHSDKSQNMISQLQKKRSIIPAVTHVDYSARVQTVNSERNPFLYQIIKEYKKLTNHSVILNTSFNVRGEPIVCTPQDAIACFYKTDMDILIIGKYIVKK